MRPSRTLHHQLTTGPRLPLNRIPVRVRSLELEAVPWTPEIRPQGAPARGRDAVEQQVLDSHVIVEVLEVHELVECEPGMKVDCRPAVQR
jgi:hypothetical protein